MKITFTIFCCFIFCFNTLIYSQISGYEHPNADPELLQKDFGTWWNYTNQNVNLTENYIPLDTVSKVISRESFLNLLSSGDYFVLKLAGIYLPVKYKLYKLNPLCDKSIRTTAKDIGVDGYRKYKMEGTKIPDFNFTDLNGRIYNNENTNGKIIVLKFWFIHCQACVAEMPAVNEVVKEYRRRKDIVFLSLAYNSKEELKNFLTQTKFDYAVISMTESYIEDTLKVYRYPTQFVINKGGVITKVVNDYHDMISALKIEADKE